MGNRPPLIHGYTPKICLTYPWPVVHLARVRERSAMNEVTTSLSEEQREHVKSQGSGYIRSLIRRDMDHGHDVLPEPGGTDLREEPEEGLRARTGPESDDLATALGILLGPGVSFTISGTTKHVAARSPEGRGRDSEAGVQGVHRAPRKRKVPVRPQAIEGVDPVTGEVL